MRWRPSGLRAGASAPVEAAAAIGHGGLLTGQAAAVFGAWQTLGESGLSYVLTGILTWRLSLARPRVL